MTTYSHVGGFACLFEAWTHYTGDANKIRSLRAYVQSKGKRYLNVPAAGVNSRNASSP